MTPLAQLRALADFLNDPASKRRENYATLLHRFREELPGIVKGLEASPISTTAQCGAGEAPAWPTDDQVWDCIRLTFPESIAAKLSFKRWKDGIDIDYPTHDAMSLARQFFAMGVVAGQSAPPAPVRAAQEDAVATVIEALATDFECSVHHVWDNQEVADRLRDIGPAYLRGVSRGSGLDQRDSRPTGQSTTEGRRVMSMKCPECGSTDVSRYSNNGLDCNKCGHMGRSQDFGARCTCSEPHHTPLWHCPVHGEVTVPMD